MMTIVNLWFWVRNFLQNFWVAFGSVGTVSSLWLLKPFEHSELRIQYQAASVTLNFQASNSLYTLAHEEAVIHIESLDSATSDQNSSRNSAEYAFLVNDGD